jgi:hypothetical protein
VPSPSKTQTDSGAITAEFAVALPAMATSVAVAIAAVALASMQLSAQQLAGTAVRALSQGVASVEVAGMLRRLDPSATLRVSTLDGLLCAAIAKRPPGALILLGIQPNAKACTWVGKYFDQP